MTHEGRDERGRLLPGHTTKKRGPSRWNVAAVVKRKAKEIGLDPEDMLFDVMLTMIGNAARGDTKAAKIVFDWLGQKEPKGPDVAVQINNGAPGTPQLPPLAREGKGPVDATLEAQLQTLMRIAEERGLADIKASSPTPAARALASVRQSELDDLLS